MKNSRVSIIIPAYSAARFIGAALDSVFAQTFRDYEVVLVNDGSPDTRELEEVLKPYEGKIEYIVQENRGLSGARNTGIRAARSEFVAFLDADDIWEPNYLQRQFEEIERRRISRVRPRRLGASMSCHAGIGAVASTAAHASSASAIGCRPCSSVTDGSAPSSNSSSTSA